VGEARANPARPALRAAGSGSCRGSDEHRADGGAHAPARASNEKAKRELGWKPRYASWRRGFAQGLG
jgi:nucleoside-diphosphate-sugar epimerase